jgi:hypothetical protein
MHHCLGKACSAPREAPQDFDINIIVNFLFEWHLGYICHFRSFTMVNCMLLSHVTSSANIKIFSDHGPDEYMWNVVYREVLKM